MKIKLTHFKSFPGMEGDGFSAHVHCNGIKVAEVTDTADGGEWYWRVEKGRERMYENMCQIISELPAAELKVSGDRTITLPMDIDIWIEENLLDIADAKYFNRRKVLFINPEDNKIYSFGTYSKEQHKDIERVLQKRIPGAIMLNGKPIEKEVQNA